MIFFPAIIFYEASHEPTGILAGCHIRMSMTVRYNPTDNAVAERMNGILKVEWIFQQEMCRDYETASFEIGCMTDFCRNCLLNVKCWLSTFLKHKKYTKRNKLEIIKNPKMKTSALQILTRK